MAKKRIDPKLPIPEQGVDRAAVPDTYDDRLLRRLNELFREQDDGTIAIFDEETYIGQATGLNFTGAGVTASQAANLPVGNYDVTIPGGGGGTLDTLEVEASEDVETGDLINVFSDGGTFKGRLAKASTDGYEAHGFSTGDVSTGDTITVRFLGKVTSSSGLTPGSVFLSETPGKATSTCPSGSGKVAQQVGVSESATSFAFEWQPAVLLAATHDVTSGGNTLSQTFTTTGTYVINSLVGAGWLSMIGGGGGGRSTSGGSSAGGGGGGSGEFCQNLMIPLTPGETITVTIGAGGGPGTDGGTTSVTCDAGTFSVLGGKGATSGSGASGGGPRGGTGGAAGNPAAAGALGTGETPCHFGGSSGGGGGNVANGVGGPGGGSAGFLTGGAAGTSSANGGAGGGGGASWLGNGGAGGDANGGGVSAAANTGAGGGGAGGNSGAAQTAGSGGSGYVVLMYVA